MKKILVVLIFTISLSAQNYFKDSDQFIAYTEYADSIIGLVKPPKAPDQIELLELFGMDEKEEQKVLKKFPDNLIKMLKEIKSNDKMQYYDFLNQKRYSFRYIPFPEGERLIDERKSDREDKILTLEIETTSLAIKYKNNSDSGKEKIKSDLKTKLNALFDLKEEERKEEVAELEKRLKELKKSLDTRKKNKDEIVSRRIRELTGENEYLRWD